MFTGSLFIKGLKSFAIAFGLVILGNLLKVSGFLSLIVAFVGLVVMAIGVIYFIRSVAKEQAKLKFFSIVMILFTGYISLLLYIGIRDSLK